ncbi:hypothetical protein EON63_10240 [archaeon]|nr:MAG: hypothetical protein EON63_10240 [archaeon]
MVFGIFWGIVGSVYRVWCMVRCGPCLVYGACCVLDSRVMYLTHEYLNPVNYRSEGLLPLLHAISIMKH